MVSCPNCGKKLRDTFEYCRICGSRLDGKIVGDFRTDMLNVFRHPDSYIYLFACSGNQDVIMADSLEELERIAVEKKYPWESYDWKDSFTASEVETRPVPEFSTEFLKASSLKEPEIIPTSSTRKEFKRDEDESYVPDYEVSRVVETSVDFSRARPKRNPNRNAEIPESEIPEGYGIRGVFRHDGKWAFRTNETSYTIHDYTLKGLKEKIESKGYDWQIVDSELAEECFEDERLKAQMRDDEILQKRRENEEASNENAKIKRELSRERQNEIDRKLKEKNMDMLLK